MKLECSTMTRKKSETRRDRHHARVATAKHDAWLKDLGKQIESAKARIKAEDRARRGR
jgi:hypothetical protein